MNDETAYDLAQSEYAELVTCKARRYSGLMVCYQGRVSIVDEEFDSVTHLPAFITDEDQATKYLQELDRSFDEGYSYGQGDVRREFRKLMGFEEKGEASYEIDQHLRHNHPESL